MDLTKEKLPDIRVSFFHVRRGTRIVARAEHWESGVHATSLPHACKEDAETEARQELAEKLAELEGRPMPWEGVEHHTR